MTTRDQIEHAAELLRPLTEHATPGPWRDGSVDGNRYAALVSPVCIRRCDEWADRYSGEPPGWTSHPHDGYGGCLVSESQRPEDRRLMAVMRNVAGYLPELLEAVAHEDPIEVGRITRGMAQAIVDTHTPAENVSPTSDTNRPNHVTHE
ncbi:MAG: hypothetical protein CMF72_24580 [Mameliella sp.]|nr:hypothetical protein [Mameliella sp.]|tara:strand:+ start:730 stop:1176 length:447 start_codon:yes stop_codon:yes gene_type:complete